MTANPPNPSRRGKTWTAMIALVLVLIGLVCWQIRNRSKSTDRASSEGTLANVRGIGLMDRFEYQAAAEEFDKVVKNDPDWLPGKINLAIALLNTTQSADLERARKLLQEVVKRDPDNPHANYCLGIIALHQNQLEEATRYFELVTRIDPNDAHAWLHRGLATPNKDESPDAKGFFRKALDLNPYLNAARYALAQHRFEHDDKKSKELLDEFQTLVAANAHDDYRLAYTEMGRYGLAIGAEPTERPQTGPLPILEPFTSLKIELAPSVVWAKPGDIERGAQGALRQALRKRFGATMVRLDYDGDGQVDLLLLGAVTRQERLGNLLLHNEGGGRFSDATLSANLGELPAAIGCSVADFDNDGKPDLLLTGPGGVHLLRNVDGKHFEDRTKDAGLDKLSGVFLSSTWLDIDQDGDLDLLICRYASTPDDAIARLTGRPGDGSGELLLFVNSGEAVPFSGGSAPGLTVRFQAKSFADHAKLKGPVVACATLDIDGDLDLDLVALVDGQPPVVIVNDRLLRFHLETTELTPAAAWNGALAFDLDHDDQSDLLLQRAGAKPVLLRSRKDTPARNVVGRFGPGDTDSPPLLQAEAVDFDCDGWTDIVGLSDQHRPVLLQNDGAGQLLERRDALTPGLATGDVLAVNVADVDGDGLADVVLWSAGGGLQAWRNLGNANRSLRVELSGRRDVGSSLRTNADGIGARVTAHAGSLRTSIENTTLAAGLGQSRGPLTFGLGRAKSADTVRIRWPDGVPQAEMDQQAGAVRRLVEISRRSSSCPVLFTWDGQRFAFVTDFLGAGSIGELAADGSTRPPRPEESVLIEPGRLVSRHGQYLIKIAEPMDEVLYLDWLRLDVIDHPTNATILPDERFAVADPLPSQNLLTFTKRIFAKQAVDHRGGDVTALLIDRDGKMVDQFRRRSWTGFAEDHHVDLDFGAQLASVPRDQRLFLVLSGWTDYPYPESIYAAGQAGVAMKTPLLSRQERDGTWRSLGEIGFPAGLPRTMISEVMGVAGQETCRLRLSTNLQIHWDQIYLAPLSGEAAPRQVHQLPIKQATLVRRGMLREIVRSPGLVQYDDDHTEPVEVSRWQGAFTAPGDVTKHLQRDDDLFAVCGPGDEIVVTFDDQSLPNLPAGYARSFVLRTRGYCRDASPFTLHAGQVEPRPAR